MARTIFGSDRPLLYNVDPWNELGFAVPNWGTNIGTTNKAILKLADEIGRQQLFITTHEDVGRLQPPSINTVMRIGKMVNRVQSVLVGRMKLDPELRLEGVHETAAPEPWVVHPAPYFDSAIVRNTWISEYNRLTMTALTNMYQHSDNNLPLTITQKFATDIWQYFREIKILLGTELLLLTSNEVKDENFKFGDEHYVKYEPSKVTLNMEALDTPGPIWSKATEIDLKPLFEGFPSVLLLDLVKQYPVGPDGEGWSGTPLSEKAAAPGTVEGEAVAAPGPNLGGPQI